MNKLSVIICTHNPREDYLRLVLDALARQSLPTDQWELLLIDNASEEPVKKKYDLAWHPNSRHVREEELGLTPARLRGIREAVGEILVFVDDDNVLAVDYLENVLCLQSEKSYLGAFNGSIQGVFEETPNLWIRDYLGLLAVGEVKGDRWGVAPRLEARSFAPCGAGMAIRSDVANYYSDLAGSSNDRRKLDRAGKNLNSAGDFDMAMVACQMGFCIGRFERLKLKHLIPAMRLTKSYMLNLIESMAYSDEWLHFIWYGNCSQSPSLPGKIDRFVKPYHSLRRKFKMKKEVYDLFQFRDLAKESEAKGILRAQGEIAVIAN